MVRAILLGGLALWLCLVSSAVGNDAKDELKKWQGTWSDVAYTIDGKAVSKDDLKGITTTFDGANMVREKDGKVVDRGELVLSPDKSPK